jgi:hypothetical protein
MSNVLELREDNEALLENLKSQRADIKAEIKLQCKNALRKNKIDQLIRDRIAVEKLINVISGETMKQMARRYENVRQQIRSLGVEDVFEPEIDMSRLRIVQPEDMEEQGMAWRIEVFGIPPGTYIKINPDFKKWVDKIFIPDHKDELLKEGRKRITHKEREQAYFWVQRIIYQYGIQKRAMVQRDDNGNLLRVKYLESRREWVRA